MLKTLPERKKERRQDKNKLCNSLGDNSVINLWNATLSFTSKHEYFGSILTTL